VEMQRSMWLRVDPSEGTRSQRQAHMKHYAADVAVVIGSTIEGLIDRASMATPQPAGLHRQAPASGTP
jgi:hypothetical protein